MARSLIVPLVTGMSLQNWYNSTAASHTAIKFYFAAGNVEAGVIVQYRRKLSA